MNVQIIDIQDTAINGKLNQYQVDVKFKCNDCGYEYIVSESNPKKANAFFESLQNGLPNKYIGCVKCDKKDQKIVN